MNFLQQVYKGKRSWWRWLIILLLFTTPFLKKTLRAEVLKPLLAILPKDKNIYIALSLCMYIILLALFFLMFKVLHKRSFKTLITSRKKFDWLRFGLSFGTWGVISMVVFSTGVLVNPENYSWNFQLIPFLKLFTICVLLMPLQVLFKEVLVRGYILQGFNCFIKRPWVSILVSTLFYAFILYGTNKAMVSVKGAIMIADYLIAGFILGLIVVLDDGLEIVIGTILVNNLIVTLFITSKNYSFQPDSVLIRETETNVFITIITTIISFSLYFYLLTKVYDWKNWREKLLNKVEFQNN